MYSFGGEAVITGTISTVRQVATHVARVAVLGPARAEGTVRGRLRGWDERLVQAVWAPPGTFTITAVESERMWASEAGRPFGRLRGENRCQPLADGRIVPGGDPLRRTLQHSVARGPDCLLIRAELSPGHSIPLRTPTRAPNGIRTRAAALKGRCPRPLDDGGAVGFGRHRRHQPAVGTAPA